MVLGDIFTDGRFVKALIGVKKQFREFNSVTRGRKWIMKEKPLLSICIPTYNREEYLRKTLDSIVNQAGFDSGLVEIVVSDNASEDNTEELVKEYCMRYNNVNYYRNANNIRDKNFPTVLEQASGVFRKLSNDTLLWEDGSVLFMLETIKKYKDDKPVLFFRSSEQRQDESVVTLDEFLLSISYYCTSISCFGVWEEDFQYTEEGCDKFLWQVPYLFKMISNKNKAIVFNRKVFNIQSVKGKDLSYGMFQVFYVNYLGYIMQYEQATSLKHSTYEYAKKDLLFNFFLDWILEFERKKHLYNLSQSENLVEQIEKEYQNEPYYNEYLWLKRMRRIYIKYGVVLRPIARVYKSFRRVLGRLKGQ